MDHRRGEWEEATVRHGSAVWWDEKNAEKEIFSHSLDGLFPSLYVYEVCG